MNPGGFFKWPANQRMTSMMAPTLVFGPQGSKIALGSGGSNRLRTAILQVLINVIDFQMELHDAVNSPRLHFENESLSVEPGFNATQLEALTEQFTTIKFWQQQNLYFGGVHTVAEQQGHFTGAVDQRRGGVAIIVT